MIRDGLERYSPLLRCPPVYLLTWALARFPHASCSYDSAHNGIRSRGAAALSSAVWTPHPMLQVASCCRPLARPSHAHHAQTATRRIRQRACSDPPHSTPQQFCLKPDDGHASHLACDDSHRGLCLHIRPPPAACRLIAGNSTTTPATAHRSALTPPRRSASLRLTRPCSPS